MGQPLSWNTILAQTLYYRRIHFTILYITLYIYSLYQTFEIASIQVQSTPLSYNTQIYKLPPEWYPPPTTKDHPIHSVRPIASTFTTRTCDYQLHIQAINTLKMTILHSLTRSLNLQSSKLCGVNSLLRNFTTTLPHAAKPLPPRLKLLDSDLSISYLKGTGPGGQKIVSPLPPSLHLSPFPSLQIISCIHDYNFRWERERMERY